MGFFDEIWDEVQKHNEVVMGRSWCLQPIEERRLRIEAIITLCVEIDRVRKIDIHASGFATSVVEKIIEGDWEDALRVAGYLKFDENFGDPEEYRNRYRELWAGFVGLVEAVYARRHGGTA